MIYALMGRVGSGKTYLSKILSRQGLSTSTGIDTDKDVIFVRNISELQDTLDANPDKVFKLVYVSAENIDRRINYVKDAEDKIRAEQSFSMIDIVENADFTEMETLLKENNPNWIPHNLTGIFTFENKYSPEGAEKFGSFLVYDKSLHDRITKMIGEMVDMQVINTDPSDKRKILISGKKDDFIYAEEYADIMQSQHTLFAGFIEQYIMKSPRFEGL